jgi:hypothetical protein
MKPARPPRLSLVIIATATLLASALAPGVGGRARASADEVEKCTIAVQGDSPVAKACQEGGVRLAKRKMKELVRTAREKGMSADCNDCHEGGDSWTLTKGATDRFRRLLDLSK